MSAAWADLAVQPPWPEDAVEVARIGEAWGVKGWFRVIPFASDPQAIFSSRRWFIKPPEQAARPAGSSTFPEWLKITDAKSHGDGAVAHAQGLETRVDAQALRGARIFVARSSFPTESANEYYWVDLIGLQVLNRNGDSLGTVQGLIDTGPQSVLRVAAARESGSAVGADAGSTARTTERLIPFVAAYVDDVSLEAGRIIVDWELDY